MIYVPIRSSQVANLSQALYQLMRPPHLRNARDVSLYYCAWYEYQGATPSQWEAFSVLELPESETVPIHLEADDQLLVDTLAVFVADGSMTQQELDGIVGAIQAYAGQQVAISGFIPPSWQPYQMTRAQAEAAGFIATLDEQANPL